MKLDTQRQNMLLSSTDREIKDLAWLAQEEPDQTMLDDQANFGWALQECEEFLDNAALAYELLVEDVAA